ncbi:hypothetical protein F4781DRAFT_400725 [Annulohypoxylon bovei var. microspora]|nr:hypothetical protein F4781DRAFT_400725 [Annulohypoxylon bovei var. microspora]
MANNGQGDGSARACMNFSSTAAYNAHCYSQDVASEVVQRPNINVPVDAGYNLQRFLNPHLHAEDRHLRPPQSPTPLTEEESRRRMAIILNSIDMLSKRN